jgi:hypothetical protein
VRNLWATTSHGGCSGILSMVWDPRYRVLGEGLVGAGFASPPQRVFSVTTSVRTGVRHWGFPSARSASNFHTTTDGYAGQ